MASSSGASTSAGHSSLILTNSKPLRLLTLLLFYFTQGFPLGLFYYVIPGWMGANGASTGAIASVVGVASLPWSLKLVNGFLIDRYTFLPMGRRRVWIIGAQLLVVAVLVGAALMVPEYDDIFLLSTMAFVANMAVTFQDVGIDSLAVDIMAEDERAKAAGIMFGAQALGVAATTAAGGWLLAAFGITVCLLVLALVPALVALYGVLIREREGERRLPWSSGESHPLNRKVQVEAWWPLLVNATKAMLLPLSLLLIPMLLFRSLYAGGAEAFHPVLFSETGGWSLTDYTGFTATLGLVTGLTGLVLGGWLVDAVGSQKSALIAVVCSILLLAGFGAAQHLWTEDWLLIGFASAMDMIALFYAIAMIPICMRMCTPAVAATQFTIYMAIGNFGRPLGAWLAAQTAGNGLPEWLYWTCAAAMLVVALILVKVRFPTENRVAEETAHVLPQGTGLQPSEN